MKIHDILNLEKPENIYFVENSYSSLKNNVLSLQYLKNIYDTDIVIGIQDENKEIIGIAVFNQETDDTPSFWAVFTNLISLIPIPNDASKTFNRYIEKIEFDRISKTSREELNTAIYEYYSLALVNRELCENCINEKEAYEMVYVKDRSSKLKNLLKKFKPCGNIIEICCGNGMSSLPLHELGFNPITMDIDKCQICQGLEHNVLYPDKTVVLDATRLSEFFYENSFDYVLGFMMGAIYDFNKDVWNKIIKESVKILKPKGNILLTVNNSDEIKIISDALENSGVNGKIIDNRDEKGIYDQWVYFGSKV